MIPVTWADNATLEGELFEALVQTLFWTLTLNLIHVKLEKYCEKHDWFELVKKQKGGAPEFIGMARAFPQHLTSGILALIGCLFESPQLIRHATLAEFGYESFDLLRMWFLYLNNDLDAAEATKTIFAVTFHHLPGILTIIPANLYLADNIYFQKIVVSLLLPAAFNLFLAALIKTYNISDLAQRTKFTAAYVLNIVLWCIARFWYFVWYSYLIVYHGYHEWSIGMTITLFGYFIGLSIFNLLVLLILIPRLLAFMNSKTEKELQDNAQQLQKRVSIGITLQSDELFEILDYNKKNSSHAKITKLPFRRLVSEPQFKFE